MLVAAALCGAGLAALLASPGATAAADPGTCGFRKQGPTFQGGSQWAYAVGNRCGQPWSLAVVAKQRQSDCAVVQPGATAHYSLAWPDPDWYVVVC
ncbi:MAG: hypothetical protein ACT4RN_13215 [Pseudonocardia sp.]